MSAPTYEILTVHDFAKIPPDRREICLREFGVWLGLVDATMALMSGIPIEPPAAFVWVDDDKHEADVSIVGGNERVHVISGVMRGFTDDR